MNRLLLGWAFVAFLCGGCTDKNRVSVDNDIVKLEFDLQKGTYKGIDMATGQTCIYDASWRVDDYTSTDADSIYYQIEAIRDSLGKGQSIQIVSVKRDSRIWCSILICTIRSLLSSCMEVFVIRHLLMCR